MVTLSICVGSSCHLKGSYDVIEAMRKLIKEKGTVDDIDLKAAFCLGKCAFDGVSIKVNDKIITGVTPDKVKDVYEAEIAPLIEK